MQQYYYHNYHDKNYKTKINNCYAQTGTDFVLLFIQNQLIIITIIK